MPMLFIPHSFSYLLNTSITTIENKVALDSTSASPKFTGLITSTSSIYYIDSPSPCSTGSTGSNLLLIIHTN